MMVGDILSGRQANWSLIKKLGEGDAGEVYLVESLADQRRAILKRPTNSAFSGDVARQSAQIEAEGKILASLHPLFEAQPNAGFAVPALLDTSQPGAERSERLFIVIEQAPGIDLGSLARLGALGFENRSAFNGQLSPDENHFLNTLNDSGKVPERILISALQRLIDALEQVHTYSFEVNGKSWSGVLWNDVKPDHLFWDPRCARLTVIDWGNGQFLEADGATPDRRYSILDDYRQLVEEMGRLLTLVAPDLKRRLEWPDRFMPDNVSETFAGLKERLKDAQKEAGKAQDALRKREAELLRPAPSSENPLEPLEEVQRAIIAGGELPDYPTALAFCKAHASLLAHEEQLDTLRQMCEWAGRLPGASSDAWRLTARLAQITSRSEGLPRRHFLEAVQSVTSEDWESALWSLAEAVQDAPEPDWWYDLSSLVRRQQLELEADAITPLVSIKRTLLTLQSIARTLEDRLARGPLPNPAAKGREQMGPLPGAQTIHTATYAGREQPQPQITPVDNNGAVQAQLEVVRELIRRLQEEILPNWRRTDPTPPHASLAYSDVEPFLTDIAPVLPEAQQIIARAIAQPRAQVKQVLEAWKRKDFPAAAHGLRQLLLWDPDRQRTLRAGIALINAQALIQRVQMGPLRGESMLDFATTLEFEGRELRNQVGPADWLDRLLEGCKKLRRGAWPVELIENGSDYLGEMPWIAKFDRGERFAPPPDPAAQAAAHAPVLAGRLEAHLGKDGDLLLKDPLDTWVPEARGSSARVYLGTLKDVFGRPYQAAVKLMRMDKIEYASPLFREEAYVLAALKNVPGVSHLLECGFIRFDGDTALPADSAHNPARHLTGDVLRLGLDQTQGFADELAERVKEGWVPYLAVEKRNQKDNLLRYCDAGSTRGRFLPVTELVRMSVQICDILQAAHERKIVYRDHKILHYYWQTEDNSVYVIDWNVARLHRDGLSEIEIHMDLVQFGARALHHILTGRTAPGALPMGPTRPEEIEAAEQSYTTQWTYDDQRLSQDLKDILERALGGGYTNAASLGADLKRSYLEIKNGDNGSAD